MKNILTSRSVRQHEVVGTKTEIHPFYMKGWFTPPHKVEIATKMYFFENRQKFSPRSTQTLNIVRFMQYCTTLLGRCKLRLRQQYESAFKSIRYFKSYLFSNINMACIS